MISSLKLCFPFEDAERQWFEVAGMLVCFVLRGRWLDAGRGKRGGGWREGLYTWGTLDYPHDEDGRTRRLVSPLRDWRW